MKKILILLFISFLIIGGSVGIWYYLEPEHKEEFIPVGILHSLTGYLAGTEQNVVDATLLAIEEINEKGGVLGKKLKPLIVDGKSDWQTFAAGAEKLLAEDKVPVIFGGWASASRKSIIPVLEKYNGLLFYPTQYEGMEMSPYIIYTGATPNQQVIPGVTWSLYNLGKKFFLVGSDYIYPRAIFEIAKKVINSMGGVVVGEEYIKIGSQQVGDVVKKIVAAQPEVILNALVGDVNITFFKALRAAGVTPEKIPTMSFNFTEQELQQADINSMIGDYASFNYFQSLDTQANREFVKNFQARFGKDRITNDYMEAAYFGVHLWVQTLKDTGTTDPDTVKKYIKTQTYDAPEGVVSIDADNQHTWKIARIGKIQSNGQFYVVWDSVDGIQPVPYLTSYKSEEEWNNFITSLYKMWGNKWSAE